MVRTVQQHGHEAHTQPQVRFLDLLISTLVLVDVQSADMKQTIVVMARSNFGIRILSFVRKFINAVSNVVFETCQINLIIPFYF